MLQLPTQLPSAQLPHTFPGCKNKAARKGIKTTQTHTPQCLDLTAFLCRDVISPLAFEMMLTSGKNLFLITHLHNPI